MILSAFLKLDSGGFSSGIGTAIEGIRSVINISADLQESLTKAFDLGGKLSDIQAQIGELPSTIMVLRQAFEDTGVGAESLVQVMGIMRRSIAGINEQGQPTSDIFQQLGLSIDALKNMGAEKQFETIGAAISNLKTPAEQTTAAMEIFGRGGNRMLTFLKDDQAIGKASRSLGELPALMSRNAGVFDEISDRIGRIKEKSMGIWAGIAEGIAPMAESITGSLDGIDLTGIGQRIGKFIGTVTEMFRMAGWQKIITLAWEIGWKEGLNYAVSGLVELGNIIIRTLATPLSYIGAAFESLVSLLLSGLSKIPGLNKVLGLEDFQRLNFSEYLALQKRDIDRVVKENFQSKGKINLFDASSAKQQLADAFNVASPVYEEKLAAVQKKFSASISAGTMALTDNVVAKQSTATSGGNISVQADALARIGGYVGSSPSITLVDVARQTLDINKSMLISLTQIAKQRQPVAVWGA